MVFHGTPSKACGPCRQRKIKCDLKRPACSQCVRAKAPCSGYRDTKDLMFRDEREAVRRRISRQAEARRAKDIASDQDDSSQETSIVTAYHHDPLGSPASGIYQSSEDLAVPSFLAYFFTEQALTGHNIVACLPATFLSSRRNGALSAALGAVGAAAASSMGADLGVSVWNGGRIEASKQYGTAIRLTQAALQKQQGRDEMYLIILITIMLSLYEVITNRKERGRKRLSYLSHLKGTVALLDQFKSQYSNDPRYQWFSVRESSTGIGIMMQLRSHLVGGYFWPVKCPLRDRRPAGLLQDRNLYIQLCDILDRFADRFTDEESTGNDFSLVITDLDTWFASLPPYWHPSIHNDAAANGHLGPFCYAFLGNAIAVALLDYWTFRCIILIWMLKEPASHDTAIGDASGGSPERLEDFKACVASICASIPYFTGRMSPYDSTSGYRSFQIKGAGCVQILWPLFICAIGSCLPHAQRRWYVEQLEFIGEAVGVQQSKRLAAAARRAWNGDFDTGGAEFMALWSETILTATWGAAFGSWQSVNGYDDWFDRDRNIFVADGKSYHEKWPTLPWRPPVGRLPK